MTRPKRKTLLDDWESESIRLLESLRDEFDGSDHLLRSHVESVRGILRWRGFVARYIDEDIGIRLDVQARFPTVEDECRKLTFLTQQQPESDDFHRTNRDAVGQPELGVGLGGPGTHDVEIPVSIFPRPVIQDGESLGQPFRARCVEMRNVVRLHVTDEVPQFLVREWSELPGGRIEGGFGQANWEFEGVLIGRGVQSGLQDRSLINAGIESGAKLIKHLAHFEAEDRRKRASWLDPDPPCPFILYAYADVVGIRFIDEFCPSLPESFSVSLCAGDSFSASEEPVRHV